MRTNAEAAVAARDIDVHRDLKMKCEFLSDYAATMLGCGATCIRIEKNMNRIADRFKVDMNLMIMPGHVIVTLWDKSHTHSYNNMQKPRKNAINYTLNSELSRLSWEIADHDLPFSAIKAEYDKILSGKEYNKYIVLLLASFASASLCRLFGGDLAAMCIAFVATLAGYEVKLLMLARKIDFRLVVFCSAFTSALITAAARYLEISQTIDVAIAISVLYLIPGIPFINSLSDLIRGHYLSAYSRFVHACLLTLSLSLGYCLGLYAMRFAFML